MSAYDNLPRYEPGMVLTLDNVRAMVDAAIADKGSDHTYVSLAGQDSCQYLDAVHPKYITDDEGETHLLAPEVEDCEAGCIFGHALLGMGVAKEDLLNVNTSSIDMAFEELGIAVAMEVQQYAVEVQVAQDGGSNWGTSKADAEGNRAARLTESQFT